MPGEPTETGAALQMQHPEEAEVRRQFSAVHDGHVTLDGSPGQGVEIASEWLARSRQRITGRT